MDRQDHCLNTYCFSPSFLIGGGVCVGWEWRVGGRGVRLLFLVGCFVVCLFFSHLLLFFSY